MAQLLLHLIGDYLLQSGWMAANKAKSHFAAFVHALVYSLPFLLIRPSLNAWLVIFVTHFFIDRYSLAKRVAIIKNYLAPSKHWPKNGDLSDFGYHKCTPEFLAMWLLIITDNTLHLLINFIALKYL